jgi:hypothetical protein
MRRSELDESGCAGERISDWIQPATKSTWTFLGDDEARTNCLNLRLKTAFLHLPKASNYLK